jgi:predicted lipoprotein with Yx(FWY)xxD motif
MTLALAIGAAALLLAACGDDDDGGGGDASAANPGGGSGLVSVESVDGTDVLADSQGRTLYTADVEEDGRILCTGACTSIWDPVESSADDARSASEELGVELGVVMRPDGDRQLTMGRVPLYTFTEEGPGELEGDGFTDDFEGTTFVWEAAGTGAGSGSPESGGPNPISPY